MPDHARVWVYQANKNLTNYKDLIAENLQYFTENWESHGQKLLASFQILQDRFVILAVDSKVYSPSGCSIDKSVALLQELGQQISVDFFDRSTVFYKKGNEFESAKLPEIKQKVASGELKPETLVLNTLIESKSELENAWQKKADQTWLARYF